MRLRHANAQPCFRPATNDGSDAGSDDGSVTSTTRSRRAPGRHGSGSAGCCRRPDSTPLAIDGAAPMTITNRIAPSVSWNRRMARGNQAMDGIVWRPVIIEPIAIRSTLNCEQSPPMTTPTPMARAKPTTARCSVYARGPEQVAVADPVPQRLERGGRARAGRTPASIRTTRRSARSRGRWRLPRPWARSATRPVAATRRGSAGRPVRARRARPGSARRSRRARAAISSSVRVGPAVGQCVSGDRWHGGAPPREVGS